MASPFRDAGTSAGLLVAVSSGMAPVVLPAAPLLDPREVLPLSWAVMAVAIWLGANPASGPSCASSVPTAQLIAAEVH